jgi:ribose transport system substrate-binding protein
VKISKLSLVATVSLAAVLAACSSSASTSPSAAGSPNASAVASAAPSVAPSTAAVQIKKIAFFGFWKSNSFTLAVLQGVKTAAATAGSEVVDLTTPTYDAAAQMKAVQDQTVKGDAQMYVLLADDSVGMATAAKEAMAKGITVVAAFTPLGSSFDTLEPQVPGLIVVGETPVANGKVLAELAVKACGSLNPCNVAYLEGLKALPLDNARTQSFLSTLAAGDANAKVVADVEGGYTPDQGKKAAQDALQRNPDINVMVGSSQAIIGAQSVVDVTKVKLIGNGASQEAFAGVNSGQWFALYNMDVVGMGAKSVEMGLAVASGQSDVRSFDTQTLRDPSGTKDVLAKYTPAYSDLK